MGRACSHANGVARAGGPLRCGLLVMLIAFASYGVAEGLEFGG